MGWERWETMGWETIQKNNHNDGPGFLKRMDCAQDWAQDWARTLLDWALLDWALLDLTLMDWARTLMDWAQDWTVLYFSLSDTIVI